MFKGDVSVGGIIFCGCFWVFEFVLGLGFDWVVLDGKWRDVCDWFVWELFVVEVEVVVVVLEVV